MGTWHLNWPEILLPAAPWLEKLSRPLLVYLFLVVALRLSGKQELSQATLFDFLVILLISNVVQNAMIGADNSVLGSFAGAAMLLALAWLLNRATARSKRLLNLLEGSPALLIRDGVVLAGNLRREHLSDADLYAGLRAQGVANLSEVRVALLELDGTISVIRTAVPEALCTGPGNVLPPEMLAATDHRPAAAKKGSL